MINRIALFFILTINMAAFGQTKPITKIKPTQSTLKNNSVGEKTNSTDYQILWQNPASVKIYNAPEEQHILSFKSAEYLTDDITLPHFSKKIKLQSGQDFNAEIIHDSYVMMSDAETSLIKNKNKISNKISVKTNVLISRKEPFGKISFVPIRKNNSTGKYEKLVSFDLAINTFSSEKSANHSPLHTFGSHSVLENGRWYKIAITTDGIYKIDYTFLHRNLGIDLSTTNANNIRIYGNGGGMLPELNSVSRADDLAENAIKFVDNNNNGIFDTDDYLLFYGKGPNTWTYKSTNHPKYQHLKNLYSDSAYYFITVDLGAGRRIQSQASSSSAVTNNVTTFDDYGFHELDAVNLIRSGRQWYGEYFDNIASYSFSFPFPNISFANGDTVTVKASLASLDASGNSSYSIVSSTGSTSLSIGTVPSGGDTYALPGSGNYSFIQPASAGSVVSVNVTKQTSDAVGWLNYVEVNARRQLIMNGNQLFFRDAKSVGAGNVAQYTISSNTSIQIWDVTDVTTAYQQTLTTISGGYQFTLPADELRQFVAFTNSSFLIPSVSGTVPNQDLHGLSNKEFIIVTHPEFYQEALELAAYHQTNDSIYSNVVTTDQIYNEFSSGAKDVSAIRDFVKMFYNRAGGTNILPKYLLLFGDGSYDNKMRFSNNTDFIPTYESYESLVITQSYVSDDFYGCLDDNDGGMVDNVDAVDIGIGRFPVDSKSEADAILNKIYTYKKTGLPSTANTPTNSCSNTTTGSPFGDWRNTVCFIADDDDNDLHIGMADQLATIVDTAYKVYNINKIYLDAYVEQASPGGDVYPDVNLAITNQVEKGCLIMNYNGHGGEVGLSHKRVVDIGQINSWNNINNMPLFFTATCELSRYDDPEFRSAGEYMFINPVGAAIALFTTTRETYANLNFDLNNTFINSVFKPINSSGKMPRLGDIYYDVKTGQSGPIINGRNFTLFGDPALTLDYAKYNVSTDSINSHAITTTITDTLKALSKITIAGFVRDNNNNILTNYNGVMYPTVYDKARTVTTLQNDNPATNGTGGSPYYNFLLQNNILYKGKVSVKNGHFRFTFVVPKDIAYNYGFGKLSYYGENGTIDAKGYNEKIIVGGTNTSAAAQTAGPVIRLYMNDDHFVYDGITNQNPDIYSLLSDPSGINTVGNGIGHDITAILDNNTTNTIVLNDYYQADLNTYQSGTVRYSLSGLSNGTHTLKLKAWDAYNNSSEALTEFVVAQSAQLALSHVLNYPNPFTTKTQFYFEDNICCQLLNVEVQIFTVSGKLVKSIDRLVNSTGFRSDPIDWDGRDEYGDKIGRGVYIYRVKIKSTEGGTAEKYEKLVILN